MNNQEQTLNQGQFCITQGSGSSFAQAIFQSCNAIHAGAAYQMSHVDEIGSALAAGGMVNKGGIEIG